MKKNLKDEKSFVDSVFLIHWFPITGIVGEVLFLACVGSVAETYPDVRIHFEHKLIAADIEGGHLTFKW